MIAAFQIDIDIQRDRRLVDVVIISAGGIYIAAKLSPERAERMARQLTDAAQAARAEAMPIEQESLAP